jgi:6-pyruvoyltetrahydropterin/6-carboxytetrahydropterin synthase
MPITLTRKYQIEAAHRLPHVPEGHKCKRLHGHSFHIEVVVKGEPDPKMGWLIDYWDLDSAFAPLFDALDHRFLNEVPGLENPTSENLARWIFDRLKPKLAILREIRISETCLESCIYSET